MGFRNGAIATVWGETRETRSPNFVTRQISIRTRNKTTGEFEKEFGGYVGFAGAANVEKIKKIKERELIKLGSVDVTQRFTNGKEYVNYTVFDFEPYVREEGAQNKPQANVQAQTDANPVDGGDNEFDVTSEELPF